MNIHRNCTGYKPCSIKIATPNHWRKQNGMISAQQLWKIVSKILTVSIITTIFLLPTPAAAQGGDTCAVRNDEWRTGEFVHIATPLNDLGASEYLRITRDFSSYQPTGFFGGLYPGGSNVRPAAHESAGVALAHQIVPLNAAGNPDANGRVVLISVGMSNVAMEFGTFMELAAADPDINPALTIVNGAQPSQVSNIWADPNSEVWQNLDTQLANAGVTPAQVQVAWVKNTRTNIGDFPQFAQTIQSDLEAIARNLKAKYPNIKIAYFSSRTNSYTHWVGLSPEPGAYESGFSVKWMIEKQLDGDAALNFRPENGTVVAPFLAWGPYLWADGTNPRSDGFVWLPTDMVRDCTHPSDVGRQKIAELLLQFLKTDTTATPWFLANPVPAPEIPPETVSISGALMGTANFGHSFTATTAPISVTVPLTYIWRATDALSITRVAGITDQVSFNWDSGGIKNITVTVQNQFGTITGTHMVIISDTLFAVYLPIVLK